MVARSNTPPTQPSPAQIIAEQDEQIRALRAEVEELNARRTLFLSASAHELKTPLTVLQVYLETLRNELSEGMTDEQLSFLAVCHDSVLRLRRLVLDLVDLAALDSGRAALEREAVELEPALAEVVAEMGTLATRSGVALALEIVEPVSAHGDLVRVRQIVRNLVDNAIQNTRSGGSVVVAAIPLEDAAEISVTDTGTGIPAERMDEIFEEFVQLGQQREGGGSGLGLAICRRLADAMGGRVTVSSREGEGSRFTVTLPRANTSGD